MTKVDIKIGDGIQTKSRRLTLWDLAIGDFYTTDKEPNKLRRVWNKSETEMATVTEMATEMATEMDYKWTKKLEAQDTLVTRYNRVVLEALEPQTTIGDTNG